MSTKTIGPAVVTSTAAITSPMAGVSAVTTAAATIKNTTGETLYVSYGAAGGGASGQNKQAKIPPHGTLQIPAPPAGQKMTIVFLDKSEVRGLMVKGLEGVGLVTAGLVGTGYYLGKYGFHLPDRHVSGGR